MKQKLFSIRLAPDQAQVVQSLLPHGYSLQQFNRDKPIVHRIINNTRRRVGRVVNRSQKVKLNQVNVIILYVVCLEKQEIFQTPDDELYAKSPRFLTEEQRQVFVVFNLLTRHPSLNIQTELIQMFDGVQQKIMEAPVGYTIYHFWIDIRNIFKFMRQNNQPNTIIIENYFNEIFNKKVLNNYRSIMGKLKHQKNIQNTHYNEMKLEKIQENMLSLAPENLQTLWGIVNEYVPEQNQNQLNFNLRDLPNSILSKLDKFICRSIGKKRIKSNESGSISDAVFKTDQKQCLQMIESEYNSQDISDS